MSTPRDPRTDLRDPNSSKSRGGHGWMMIACCVPMLVIAIVLVTTGVVGSGFVFGAVACAVMMAVMMRGMGSGNDSRR